MSNKFPLLYEAKTNINNTGRIKIFENTNLPFIPKRIFFIDKVPQFDIRGNHAHKNCEQFFLCVKGAVDLHMEHFEDKTNLSLAEDYSFGIYVPPLVWTRVVFAKPDSRLLVLCSEEYNELDYIRNYEEFKYIMGYPI